MISLQQTIADAYKPRPIISVDEWADKNRMLSSMSSAEPGPWRTERFPFLRPIMQDLSATSPVQEIIVMKGAQVGLTEVGLNWIGYIIDITPTSMMLVMPNDKVLKKNSVMRITPLLEDTPSIKNKIAPASAKTGGNNTFMKVFPGGILNMASAEAPAGLSSTPVCCVFLDEVDRFPLNVGNEGNPISLAQKRTATYRNRKIYKISTPTVAGVSLIEKEYLKGDQRKLFCPCIHCASLFVLEFDYLRWEVELDGKTPKNVYMECPHCGGHMRNSDKNYLLSNAVDLPTNKAHSNPLIKSYHISSLYSPHGFYSWEQLVSEYLEALGDDNKMITFTNTVLGLPSTTQADTIEWQQVRNKAEAYNIGIPPKGVIFLTAGVDVQHDRLELEVVGWGKNRESWSIDYIKIHGSPIESKTWLELDKILNREFIREDGARLKILRMCVDSGYLSQYVYSYVRSKPISKVSATKGKGNQLRLYDGPIKITKDSAGNQIADVLLYHLGVDYLKSELFSLLKLNKDGDIYPEGYCHFPIGYEDSYFQGLASEELRYSKDPSGFDKTKWVKIYQRNEPLDCRNYARAAASIIGYDRMTPEYLDNMEIANKNSIVSPQSITNQNRQRVRTRNAEDFW